MVDTGAKVKNAHIFPKREKKEGKKLSIASLVSCFITSLQEVERSEAYGVSQH